MLDNLTPYWSYSVEGFKATDVTGEELIIWKNGCCVYLYNDTDILEAYVYTNTQNWDEAFFEKIFLHEAMGVHNQKIKKLWVADERALIIPEKLFLGEESRLWLKRLHHIGPDDDIFDNKIPEINAHVVYAYDSKIAQLMKRYFNHLQVVSLSRFSLGNIATDHEGSVANLILLQNEALLSVTNSGKLLAHQTFEFETVENVVFKIALIAEKNDFDPSLVQFNVSGIIENVEEFALDLKTYFNDVQITTGDKGPILQLIKQIIRCA